MQYENRLNPACRFIPAPNLRILSGSIWFVKSSIPNDGIFVEKFADMYLAFFEHANGIDLSYQSQQGGINESQELIEVVGSGNNFTAYFKSGNISTIISGTLSQDGIIDFYYAFIMLDVNIYRIFKDGDDFAEKQTWLR